MTKYMKRIRLITPVKMDSPYAITGDKDAVLDLDDMAAKFAVSQRLAVFEDKSEPQESTGEDTSHGTLDKIGEDEQPDSEPEKPKRPYANATKASWIKYAVAIDSELTEERAEGMTKADLMSKYGERL